jgi:hypothetical protein
MESFEGGAELGRAMRERERARREELVTKTAGQLVAEGKCEQAVSLALQEGNFALATQVKEFCATTK